MSTQAVLFPMEVSFFPRQAIIWLQVIMPKNSLKELNDLGIQTYTLYLRLTTHTDTNIQIPTYIYTSSVRIYTYTLVPTLIWIISVKYVHTETKQLIVS